MSELPDQRAGTPAAGAKEHAWTSVNEARASWSGAMRAHEQAPPDPGFRDRLRSLADAAAEMRNAHVRALEAGLAWRPIADSERARPPYELRRGTGRRGPAELWAGFDAAVQRLNQAGAADNLGRRCRRLRRSSACRVGAGRRAPGRGRVTRKRSSRERRLASTGPARTRESSFHEKRQRGPTHRCSPRVATDTRARRRAPGRCCLGRPP